MKIRRRFPHSAFLLLLGASIVATGCSPDPGQGAEAPDLVQQGKLVYLNVCIACHNGNPALDGSVGPAIAGASEALLTAKLLRGEYPPGYTPKRPGSGVMPRFPQFAEQIPALAAFLDSIPAEDPPN